MAEIAIDLTEIHERFNRLEEILLKEKKERKRMSAKEAAKAYGLSSSTIKRWAADNKIPGHQTPGGKWFFFSDELEEADKKRFK